jgi:molybdate transport system substrate-binding protein
VASGLSRKIFRLKAEATEMWNFRGCDVKLWSIGLASLLTLVAACESTPAAAPEAAAVRVLSSNGVKGIIDEARPEIERAIGRPLAIEFSTSASLKAKIEQGEPFDVAILTPAIVDDLVKQGKIAAGSSVNVARSGVGVGAREGAPAKDVSTADALKRTLLEANKVAFTAEGQSRATIDRTFDRLGIADAMRPKVMLLGPAGGPAAVAKGDADLTLTLVSEIIPIPGVQLLGPLPADLQSYVSFAAGRGSQANDAAAADALLRQLSGPIVTSALESHGMEAVE